MIKVKQEKFTNKQFNEKYPNDEACLHEIFLNRYSDTKKCSQCDKPFSFYKVSNRKCYVCSHCGHHLHPLANTIFHKSPTPLKDWFFAIFLFANSKNGVSAKELERQLGVTYKCAWRMAKQIRLLFVGDGNMLSGSVQVDETYFGGKEINKHSNKKTANAQGRSTKIKTPIVGAVEVNGNVIARVVDNTTSKVVIDFINKNIEKNSEINSDEYWSYSNVIKHGYTHKVVEHGRKQYVAKNGASTNTMEGFWSQLKRSINGTYHNVSAKYLQQYVNEFAFRYNLRNSQTPIFTSVISMVWKLV